MTIDGLTSSIAVHLSKVNFQHRDLKGLSQKAGLNLELVDEWNNHLVIPRKNVLRTRIEKLKGNIDKRSLMLERFENNPDSNKLTVLRTILPSEPSGELEIRHLSTDSDDVVKQELSIIYSPDSKQVKKIDAQTRNQLPFHESDITQLQEIDMSIRIMAERFKKPLISLPNFKTLRRTNS